MKLSRYLASAVLALGAGCAGDCGDRPTMNTSPYHDEGRLGITNPPNGSSVVLTDQLTVFGYRAVRKEPVLVRLSEDGGREGAWTSPTTARFLETLPPGDYLFEIRQAHKGGTLYDAHRFTVEPSPFGRPVGALDLDDW